MVTGLLTARVCTGLHIRTTPLLRGQGLAMLIIRGCRTYGRILVMSTRTAMARYTSHLHCIGCTTLPIIFHIKQFCRSLHRRRSACLMNLSVTQTRHHLKIPYLLTNHSTWVRNLGLLSGLNVLCQLGTDKWRLHSACNGGRTEVRKHETKYLHLV